jgi:hypothetical protein
MLPMPTAPTSMTAASPAMTTGISSPTPHRGRPVRRGVHPPGIHRMAPAADVRPMHGPRTGLHLGYAHHPAR